MSKNHRKPNALIHSKSLYLQQHAYNPVHWTLWSKEALNLAQVQNKPILLSIGYSACHWCHVMAHESFEDPAIAELMNKLFINIKVDREERPDLDKIYQTSYQLLMKQSGGWPLTLFLTPDTQLPFFGGTYFPPTMQYGLPGFKDVLIKVAEYFAAHRKEISAQNVELQHVLNTLADRMLKTNIPSITAEIFPKTAQMLLDSIDPEYGGFGDAPKFPRPCMLHFLFEYYCFQKDAEVNQALQQTLKNMANGGIFDHIGGGFFRYTIDARWEIPHFEKMLYDNGQLLGLYALANYADTAKGIADWTIREMQSPEGAYYATLDADSEGKEGQYYLWQKNSLKKILTTTEYKLMESHFGLAYPANFDKSWHLYIEKPLSEKELSIFHPAREKLLNLRKKRPHPTRNEAKIVSLNGLMIKGMAIAGRQLEASHYINSAQRAVDDIYQTLWDKQKKQLKYAFLDDYAYLLDGLLELLQTDWRSQDLHFAIALADALIEHFADQQNGGFFFTSNAHEKLIHRPKPFMDEMTPSGNGIASLVLLRLGYLLAETRYLSIVDKTLNSALSSINHSPHMHTTFLRVLKDKFTPTKIIILRGESIHIKRWQKKLQKNYDPQQLIFAIPESAADLPEALSTKIPVGKACAYVCEKLQCSNFPLA